MKQLGTFSLDVRDHGGTGRNPEKQISIEVLVDSDNTVVVLDCQCCRELLSNRLPGGILIPIASALKEFFRGRGMRNVSVKASGPMMKRTYKGVIDGSTLPELKQFIEGALYEFSKKRRTG
jgi:hypothetical protein